MYRRTFFILSLLLLTIIIVASPHNSSAQNACGDIPVYGAIGEKWTALGGANSPLGCPLAAEGDASGGRIQNFQYGYIAWQEGATEAFAVYGVIGVQWSNLNRETGHLGFPTSDELGTQDGVGRYNWFEHGWIIWHPDYGANATYGAIGAKWSELGGAAGTLGYPVGDDRGTGDGIGAYNEFERGIVYWYPDLGAHAVYGEIGAKWIALNREAGFLGYPISDEMGTQDGIGRYSSFEHGWIIWHPDYGANATYGAIGAKWSELRGAAGTLGYPLGDDRGTNDGIGAYNEFERGLVYWHPDLGAQAVYGEIGAEWIRLGTNSSFLGYPVTEELPLPGTNGRYMDFENGSIRSLSAGNTKTLLCTNHPTNFIPSSLGTINLTVSGVPNGPAINLVPTLQSQLAAVIPNAQAMLTDQVGRQIQTNTDFSVREPQAHLNSTGDLLVKFDRGHLFLTYRTYRNWVRFYVTTPDGFPRDLDPLLNIYFDLEFTLAIQVPNSFPGSLSLTMVNGCIHNAEIDSGNFAADIAFVVDDVVEWFAGEGFIAPQEDRLNNEVFSTDLSDINGLLATINNQLSALPNLNNVGLNVQVDPNTGAITLNVIP